MAELGVTNVESEAMIRRGDRSARREDAPQEPVLNDTDNGGVEKIMPLAFAHVPQRHGLKRHCTMPRSKMGSTNGFMDLAQFDVFPHILQYLSLSDVQLKKLVNKHIKDIMELSMFKIHGGFVFKPILEYLSFEDVLCCKRVSKSTRCQVEQFNLFNTYGPCSFSNSLLGFDMELDGLMDYQHIIRGGVLLRRCIGGRRSELRVCIPTTTEHVNISVGLTRMRSDFNDLVGLRPNRYRLEIDDVTFPPEFRRIERFPNAYNHIFHSLFVMRNCVQEQSFCSGNGFRGRLLENGDVHERRPNQGFTFVFSYTTNSTGTNAFRMECRDLNLVRELHSDESRCFLGPYTWFVEMGPSYSRLAANMMVKIDLNS